MHPLIHSFVDSLTDAFMELFIYILCIIALLNVSFIHLQIYASIDNDALLLRNKDYRYLGIGIPFWLRTKVRQILPDEYLHAWLDSGAKN